MRRHRRAVDEERVRAAILAAEETTTAPIRVSLAPYFWGDVRRAAHRAAAPRDGVLFFVVPARREFAILGDTHVHERLGQATWNAIAASVAEEARSGDLTTALVHGIQDVGRRLAAHFPRRDA